MPRIGPVLSIGFLGVIGVMAFGAFLLLSAYAPMLRQGERPGGHALSRSAIGYHALGTLLEGTGERVLRLRTPLYLEREGAGLTVLTPERFDLRDVRLMPESAVLVVLPKWRAGYHPTEKGWAGGLIPLRKDTAHFSVGGQEVSLDLTRRTNENANGEKERLIEEVTLIRKRGPGKQATLDIGEVDGLQTISSDQLVPLWTDSDRRTVLGRLKTIEALTDIYVLAEPDLLNTRGLASIERASTATELLSDLAGGKAIIFDLTLNGFNRPRNLITLIVEPPLLGVSLSILVAAGLIAAASGQRFGPPARIAPARSAGAAGLIDAAAALLVAPRRAGGIGALYARQLRQALVLRDKTRAQTVPTDARAFDSMAEEAASSRDLDELLAAARALHDYKRKQEHE